MKRQNSPHPNQTKTPAKIGYRLIKEFKREKLNGADPYGNYITWWIVQWCRQPQPVLEKRHIYIGKTGGLKTYKLAPWYAEDIKWMAENWTEIGKTMQEAQV